MFAKLFRTIASRLPLIGAVLRDRNNLSQQLANIQSAMQFEPGHFYSPIASTDDVNQHFRTLEKRALTNLPGVDINLEAQRALIGHISKYYPEQPFPENKSSDNRYFFDNQTFVWSDALFLYGMMRHLRPRRVVEVGSGFSSAVMLDTNERFLSNKTQFTFIEPYPERLHSLMNAKDRAHCRILDRRIQDVIDAPWKELEAGDILFIDSSHVSKCGSDVNQLFFDVLPSLAPGVIIHIHDVFPHFEYPKAWHGSGRSWNEDYMLRAFLQFNDSFRILLWTPFIIEHDRSFFEMNMPLCLRNTGGSIWIQRNK